MYAGGSWAESAYAKGLRAGLMHAHLTNVAPSMPLGTIDELAIQLQFKIEIGSIEGESSPWNEPATKHVPQPAISRWLDKSSRRNLFTSLCLLCVIITTEISLLVEASESKRFDFSRRRLYRQDGVLFSRTCRRGWFSKNRA